MKSFEVAKILAPLGVAFNREITEPLAEIYLSALSDLQPSQLAAAAAAAIRECEFFPVPAKLRELSGAGKVAIQDASLSAWLACRRAINVYASADIHDPATAATIEAMGGWVAFCNDDREEHWIEKDFLRWHEHFSRQRLTEGVKSFAGLHEVENGDRFPAFPARRLQIGSPAALKALPVSSQMARR